MPPNSGAIVAMVELKIQAELEVMLHLDETCDLAIALTPSGPVMLASVDWPSSWSTTNAPTTCAELYRVPLGPEYRAEPSSGPARPQALKTDLMRHLIRTEALSAALMYRRTSRTVSGAAGARGPGPP